MKMFVSFYSPPLPSGVRKIIRPRSRPKATTTFHFEARPSIEDRAKAYADIHQLTRSGDEMEELWWQLCYQSYVDGFRDGQSNPPSWQRILINFLNLAIKAMFRLAILILLGYFLGRLFFGS